MLVFLFTLLSSVPARAALYSCATVLGESVPLRLGDSALNEHARGLPGEARVKKHDYAGVCLETRYLTQRGPSFQFELNCPRGEAKCEGRLLGGEPLKLGPFALFDRRLVGSVGELSIMAARRERFGLIVRVSKSAVPAMGGVLPVSASGEFHFFSEEQELVMDVGADEHLHIYGSTYHRLAALEVKVRCHKENP